MTAFASRQLLQLAERLSDRDYAILSSVERFRLLQAEQVRRLYFHEISSHAGSARICRRTLARLLEHRLLHRLERRVGGIRSGSSGTTYATTATAKRLLAHRDGNGIPSNRGPYEPTATFVAHTLAIAELYVELVEHHRQHRLELLRFETEPGCWRSYTGATGAAVTLKPDAHVVVALGEFEYGNFVEIDLATAGRHALQRKLESYLAYHRSGREQQREGWFPRVVWITTSDARANVLRELITALPTSVQPLFATGDRADAVALLTDAATEEAAR
jgi:hypothetical protein